MLDDIANLRRMIGHTRIIIPGVRALLFDDAGRVLLEKQRLFGVYTSPDYSVTYPNGDEVQTFTLAFQVLSWTGPGSCASTTTRSTNYASFPLMSYPTTSTSSMPIR